MSETRLKIEADHEDDDDGNEINKSLESSKRLKIRCKENGGDQEKQRDWSDLSPDIIYSIMQRLDFIGLIRCRSVCKDWSRIANLLKRRQDLPWLVKFYVTASPNGGLGTSSLYNMSEGIEYQSCYRILHSSELDKRCSFKFYASKHGWIFFMVTNYRFRPCELFCYNPFSRKKIKLPSLTIYSDFETKGAISTNPASSDCMFFLVDSVCVTSGGSIMKIMTCKYGDATWDESYKGNLSVRDIQDVVYCNGFLYCAIRNGLLGRFDIANRNWNMIQTIYPSRTPRNTRRIKRKLLNSNEEILMVASYWTETWECVYWLDHNTMKWVRLEDRLDDNRAFFPSISTTEEANCCQFLGSPVYNFGHERVFRPPKLDWPDGTFSTSTFTTTGYTFQILMDPS